MNNWDADLPAPASENWRMAYGATQGENEKRLAYRASDTPAQTSYQAPKKTPVPFIYDSMKLSAGLSVDTEEYPFFGLWSSTALNEKPHGITVSGFLRGDNYIKIGMRSLRHCGFRRRTTLPDISVSRFGDAFPSSSSTGISRNRVRNRGNAKYG